jgi:hypothetical protein
MRHLAAALLLTCTLAVPAAAQDSPRLTLDQQTLVRCSAMFALVAGEQARGDPVALRYPALGERGSEYFVRTAARLIDDLGISRDAVMQMLNREAERVQAERKAAANPAQITDTIMQPCLVSLAASGL